MIVRSDCLGLGSDWRRKDHARDGPVVPAATQVIRETHTLEPSSTAFEQDPRVFWRAIAGRDDASA